MCESCDLKYRITKWHKLVYFTTFSLSLPTPQSKGRDSVRAWQTMRIETSLPLSMGVHVNWKGEHQQNLCLAVLSMKVIIILEVGE